MSKLVKRRLVVVKKGHYKVKKRNKQEVKRFQILGDQGQRELPIVIMIKVSAT